MRLLSVSNCPALAHQGSGYVISSFCDGLRSRGHRVDLYEPSQYEMLPILHPRANSYRQALGMARLVSRLPLRNYDAVEFWGGQSWMAMSGVKRRFPHLLTVHHTNGPEIKYDPLHRSGKRSLSERFQLLLMRRSFALPDAIVTVSHVDREWLLEHGYGCRGRVEAIEPGLSPEFHDGNGEIEREPIIGFCGNWLPKKGIDRVTAELPPILREFPSWRLQLVGVSNQFRKEEWFPSDVLPRIEVIAAIHEKAVLAELYRRMSIFVLPSKYESFGLVLAEAMACGCASVATKVGYSIDLTDGVEILHIDDGTAQSLSACVRELIRNAPLRVSMGRAGAERTKLLCWRDSVARYERLLEEWIQALASLQE